MTRKVVKKVLTRKVVICIMELTRKVVTMICAQKSETGGIYAII